MGTCFGRCLHRSHSGLHRSANNSHNTLMVTDDDNSIEYFNMAAEEAKTQKSFSIVTKLYSKLNKGPNRKKKKPVLELTEDLWGGFGETSYKILNNSVSSQSKLSKSNSLGDNISLQCLDARSLLKRNTRDHSVLSSSTPPSSLDLEWEHEVLASPAPWQLLPENEEESNFDSSSLESISPPQTAPVHLKKLCSKKDQQTTNLSSTSGWSRISTPDSLEWDHVEGPRINQPIHDSISDLGVSDLDAETEQLLSEIERLTKTALRETGQELLNR